MGSSSDTRKMQVNFRLGLQPDLMPIVELALRLKPHWPAKSGDGLAGPICERKLVLIAKLHLQFSRNLQTN